MHEQRGGGKGLERAGALRGKHKIMTSASLSVLCDVVVVYTLISNTSLSLCTCNFSSDCVGRAAQVVFSDVLSRGVDLQLSLCGLTVCEIAFNST